LLNQPIDVLLSFNLREALTVWKDSVLEISDKSAASSETRQVGLPVEHHLNEQNDFFSVRLDRNETLGHSPPEIVKFFVVRPSQHVNHVLCELERHGLFHLDTLARRNTQQKPEVDVNQVALNVDHDVPIVTVFYLQNVADKRVRSKAVAKVISRLLVSLRSAAILLCEVVLERGVRLLDFLFECVNAHGIIDCLNEAAVGPRGQNFIGLDPEGQFLFGPNLSHL
jgi:hypothetical protein